MQLRIVYAYWHACVSWCWFLTVLDMRVYVHTHVDVYVHTHVDRQKPHTQVYVCTYAKQPCCLIQKCKPYTVALRGWRNTSTHLLCIEVQIGSENRALLLMLKALCWFGGLTWKGNAEKHTHMYECNATHTKQHGLSGTHTLFQALCCALRGNGDVYIHVWMVVRAPNSCTVSYNLHAVMV